MARGRNRFAYNELQAPPPTLPSPFLPSPFPHQTSGFRVQLLSDVSRGLQKFWDVFRYFHLMSLHPPIPHQQMQLFWIEKSAAELFLVVYRLFKVCLRSRLLPLWMDGCKTLPLPHQSIPYNTKPYHTKLCLIIPYYNMPHQTIPRPHQTTP